MLACLISHPSHYGVFLVKEFIHFLNIENGLKQNKMLINL